jgi:hypothetical protein
MARPRHSHGLSRAIARSRQAAATAKAQQDVGPGSLGEIARLNAVIAELLATTNRLQIENRGLRNELARLEEGGTSD